jgi:hypothetical protein
MMPALAHFKPKILGCSMSQGRKTLYTVQVGRAQTIVDLYEVWKPWLGQRRRETFDRALVQFAQRKRPVVGASYP